MAVSIDKVYQTVLALANKEQRGYITPQEFNLFADYAQMEIFEQYFYDLNKNKKQPGNAQTESDPEDITQDKINLFIEEQELPDQNPQSPNTHDSPFPTYTNTDGLNGPLGQVKLYRTLGVFAKSDSKGNAGIQKVTRKDYQAMSNSPLTRPTENRPVYFEDWSNKRIVVVPNLKTNSNFVSKVQIVYIRKPITPNWSHLMVNNEALYDATNSQDFELHASEQSTLILKIAKMSGIAIKAPGLTQAAAQGEAVNIQLENL